MWQYTDDPIADYDVYDAQQAKLEAQLPVCDYCDSRISDTYYDIYGETVCAECLEKHFKKGVELDA